jgi:membrane-bound serine protease (ClpP class)
MISLAQAVWQVLGNPNISFLLLVLAVWCIVLAVSAPGTGLPEGTAVISLVLAAVGLLRLPVNLGGLLLIALALVLFLLEFYITSHGALLAAGTLSLAVGAVAVYQGADASGARLSWVTVVAGPLLSSLVFGLIMRKGLAAQRAPAMQDPGSLLGQVGVTRTPVGREGSVYVGGELWSATADDGIPAETPVVVVERRGLVLKVRPAPRAGAGAVPPTVA